MKLNCMIVDDEPIARGILKNYVERLPQLQLVKSCLNAIEAYEGLHQQAVDLIFLDIRMPVVSGTDFLRSLRKPPLVVFTTAYAEYAVEGFELNSLDYLLKPITFERFYQAVQKAVERQGQLNEGEKTINKPEYVFIKQESKLVRLNYDQIEFIRAERDFTSVFTSGKTILASMHLKMFEDLLPEEIFLRVHRSYIVNLNKVSAIEGNLLEINNKRIPIGPLYKGHLLKRLL